MTMIVGVTGRGYGILVSDTRAISGTGPDQEIQDDYSKLYEFGSYGWIAGTGHSGMLRIGATALQHLQPSAERARTLVKALHDEVAPDMLAQESHLDPISCFVLLRPSADGWPTLETARTDGKGMDYGTGGDFVTWPKIPKAVKQRLYGTFHDGLQEEPLTGRLGRIGELFLAAREHTDQIGGKLRVGLLIRNSDGTLDRAFADVTAEELAQEGQEVAA